MRAGVNQGWLSFKVARVKTKSPKTENLPDFEQSLVELETLVAKLEQGDVPLEDALKTFERGVALTRQCQTALRSRTTESGSAAGPQRKRGSRALLRWRG